jgi:hypothetical protein
MRLSKLEIAKISWAIDQQAIIQIAGTGTVALWSAATTAQQEGQLAFVTMLMQNSGVPGLPVWSSGAPNASFRTGGLTVGSTPVVQAAVPANNNATPYAIPFVLAAATLTGTTNPGDVFTVGGVVYTILGFYTAASNAVAVYAYNALSGGVVTAISAATAFSSYTAASAATVQANAIMLQSIIEMLGA